MKVRDLVDVWARITGRHFAEVDLFARRLREAGYLPQGAKGRTPPDIGIEHAAHLVLATMASDVARQAPKELEKYLDVVEPVARLLAEPNKCEAIESIQIDRTTEGVRIVGNLGREGGMSPYIAQEPRHPQGSALVVYVWCKGTALEALADALHKHDVKRVT